MLLSKLLEGNITAGRLTIIDAKGKIHRFGAANASPGSTIRFHDKSLHYKDCYKLAKERVIAFAELIGKSPILSLTEK